MNTIPAIAASARLRNDDGTRARAGVWDGLVTGEFGMKHRGRHAVVYFNDGGSHASPVLCICGPADNEAAVRRAKAIAQLLNENGGVHV